MPIRSGRKTVTVAGTAEPLIPYGWPCRKVHMQALSGNSGTIYVGDEPLRYIADRSEQTNGPVATGDVEGIPLSANEPFTLEVDNVNEIWVNAATAGDGLTFIAKR